MSAEMPTTGVGPGVGPRVGPGGSVPPRPTDDIATTGSFSMWDRGTGSVRIDAHVRAHTRTRATRCAKYPPVSPGTRSHIPQASEASQGGGNGRARRKASNCVCCAPRGGTSRCANGQAREQGVSRPLFGSRNTGVFGASSGLSDRRITSPGGPRRARLAARKSSPCATVAPTEALETPPTRISPHVWAQSGHTWPASTLSDPARTRLQRVWARVGITPRVASCRPDPQRPASAIEATHAGGPL